MSCREKMGDQSLHPLRQSGALPQALWHGSGALTTATTPFLFAAAPVTAGVRPSEMTSALTLKTVERLLDGDMNAEGATTRDNLVACFFLTSLSLSSSGRVACPRSLPACRWPLRLAEKALDAMRDETNKARAATEKITSELAKVKDGMQKGLEQNLLDVRAKLATVKTMAQAEKVVLEATRTRIETLTSALAAIAAQKSKLCEEVVSALDRTAAELRALHSNGSAEKIRALTREAEEMLKSIRAPPPPAPRAACRGGPTRARGARAIVVRMRTARNNKSACLHSCVSAAERKEGAGCRASLAQARRRRRWRRSERSSTTRNWWMRKGSRSASCSAPAWLRRRPQQRPRRRACTSGSRSVSSNDIAAA